MPSMRRYSELYDIFACRGGFIVFVLAPNGSICGVERAPQVKLGSRPLNRVADLKCGEVFFAAHRN